jgi:Holliday junction resolvase RusA-like endonuclease
MKTLAFVVEGKPKSWKRVSTNKYRAKFDPNAPYKRYIGQIALAQRNGMGFKLTRMPVEARLGFFGVNMRSDVDNLAKTILDALNGVVWFDDSQVKSLIATKTAFGPPKTEIEITWDEE